MQMANNNCCIFHRLNQNRLLEHLYFIGFLARYVKHRIHHFRFYQKLFCSENIRIFPYSTTWLPAVPQIKCTRQFFQENRPIWRSNQPVRVLDGLDMEQIHKVFHRLASVPTTPPAYSALDHGESQDFTHQSEVSFRTHKVKDDQRVRVAAKAMQGEAQKWWTPYKYLLIGWDKFMNCPAADIAADNTLSVWSPVYTTKCRNIRRMLAYSWRRDTSWLEVFFLTSRWRTRSSCWSREPRVPSRSISTPHSRPRSRS